MAEPWSSYHKVIVETYNATQSSKAARVRVRPVAGQMFPESWDVECSKAMRKNHPVGTKFEIRARETNREGGKPYLYSHHSWPYRIVE